MGFLFQNAGGGGAQKQLKTLADGALNTNIDGLLFNNADGDYGADVHYTAIRGTRVQKGVLEITYDNGAWSVIPGPFLGADLGLSFDINAGQVRATATSTGTAIDLIYFLDRRFST